MRRRIRRLVGWLTIAGSVGISTAPLEAAGPWRGQVVDAETGKPLEGVVVLAIWEKLSPGVIHPARHFHDVDELVTDPSGRFVVPARSRLTPNPVSPGADAVTLSSWPPDPVP